TRIGGAEIYAVSTGIGSRSVIDELQNLIAGSSGFCIASGLAGSLRKRYPAGEIVVAKAVKAAGTDRIVKSNDSLVEIANQCGAAAVDFFYTSDAVVNSPAEKSRLGQIAGVVDMESFHVLSQAEKCGVPAVAVRAISDAAETAMPIDFNRVI